MRMKLAALVFGLFAFVNATAQTVQDGLALIHGERYKEAGESFQKTCREALLRQITNIILVTIM